MARRVHVDSIHAGVMVLPPEQAHHLRDVLRLKCEDEIELFDNAGRKATAKISECDAAGVSVVVDADSVVAGALDLQITVASAIPKGDRADWMVEKLSELGVMKFIPLRTERSVVHPEGRNKLERWERIAVESAKQCKRVGVMEIETLVSLDDLLRASSVGAAVPSRSSAPVERERLGTAAPTESNPASQMRIFLSTAPGATPLVQLLANKPSTIDLFIGPEGGWSPAEIERMTAAGLTGASLTTTILRIETAAVASAAIVASLFARDSAST